VDQVDNRKVVDLIPVYNFYKGCMGFFSTIFAQIACQVCCFLGAYDVKPRIFIENPNPCTIAIVPRSVAIAYRTSHR
jgi:hypothetical protein